MHIVGKKKGDNATIVKEVIKNCHYDGEFENSLLLSLLLLLLLLLLKLSLYYFTYKIKET